MPPYDPPFDDEVAPEVWASGHQLALDWPRPAVTSRPPAGQAHPAAGPVGPVGSTGPTGPTSPTGPTGPTGSAVESGAPAVAGASAEARLAVRRFISTCVEVINGYRPAAHLRRVSRPADAAGVVTQALAAARRATELRSARTPRTSTRHGRGSAPAAVLRMRLCEPRPGVVEAAVLLVTGERTWALAVRLEQHHQSWAATTLRLV